MQTNGTDRTTERLARFVAETNFAEIPASVIHEAKRAIIDGLGVGLGGSDHESVSLLLNYCTSLGGAPVSQVWGRPDRLPAELAALVNGQAEHVLDFDDTFLPFETVLHGTVPLLPGLLAVAEQRDLDGRAILRGFVLGLEVELRLALALGRAHYLGGWHVTATAGPVGGAVGVGAMIGLPAEQLGHAIGIALTHSGGVTAMFGSMSKAYHCGKAAEAGVRAALLAEAGFDSAPEPLTHPQGYLNVATSDRAAHHLVDALGERWRVAENGYKPYSSGVVTHPLVDALVAIRDGGVTADEVERIEARVNPWVLQATGQAEPTTGLEGKFSAYHCAAVALIDGAARPAQFTDERVNDPAVVRLRRTVHLTPDENVRKDEVSVAVFLRNGVRQEIHVEYASGTANNPMTDRALGEKFLDLAHPVVGRRADELLMDVWTLDDVRSARAIASLLAG
ncbi:MAG: MmgE/PrpD family protein [Dehalococcoidia bacterium]